jgi:hypothetical protein
VILPCANCSDPIDMDALEAHTVECWETIGEFYGAECWEEMNEANRAYDREDAE